MWPGYFTFMFSNVKFLLYASDMAHFNFAKRSHHQLVEYIYTSLSKGDSVETIYLSLLKENETVEMIQKAFSEAKAHGSKEDSGKRSVHTIVIFGAILIGAGIFSFVAANWVEMTKVMKIGIIVLSMLMSYGLGWYLQEKRQLEKVANAFYLLGTLIYGAGIFLIAQMFHVRANWPDGLLLWMFGSLAMAFALRSGTHFALALVLGFSAAFGHALELFTGMFGYRVFFTTSTFLLVLTTIALWGAGYFLSKRSTEEPAREGNTLHEFYLLLFVFFCGVTLLGINADIGDPFSWRTIALFMSLVGAIVAYYFTTVFSFILSVVTLLVWWGAQASAWVSPLSIEPFSVYVGYVVIAALFVVSGRLYQRFGRIFSLFGTVFLVGNLFFFSMQGGLQSLVFMSEGGSVATSWHMVIAYAVLLAGLGVSLIRARLPLYESLTLVVHVALFLILLILPSFSLFASYSILSPSGFLMAIMFNLLTIAQLIGVIALGYHRREPWMINLGVGGMFLFVLVKYSDWFFTFLDKSLFFIGAGLLLFGVGWLMERTRRRMIADIDPDIKHE